jgi:hypothetical protein
MTGSMVNNLLLEMRGGGKKGALKSMSPARGRPARAMSPARGRPARAKSPARGRPARAMSPVRNGNGKH